VQTVHAIIQQEYEPFYETWAQEYTRVHAPIDREDWTYALPEAEIRKFWPAFRLPPLVGGTTGSFTP